ncbi:MAG: PAS domain S-box protein [Bacteroidota bacterium]
MKKYFKENIIVITALIGFLFPVLAWVVSILLSDGAFDFSSIANIHKHNPALWLFDILPFVFVFIAVKIEDIRFIIKSRYKSLSEILQKQTDNINKVASFAEEIGDGKFEAQFEIEDDNDTLGKTLLNLRDKLQDNNKKEARQNWIMSGKEKIGDILRLHSDLNILSDEVLYNMIKYTNVVQGAFYIINDDTKSLNMIASYAYNRKKYLRTEFKIGEGLVGQACIEKDFIYRTEIPDEYAIMTSGILGDKKPTSVLIVPLITEENLQGAIEFASLAPINDVTIDFVKEISEIIARTIYNLKVNERTERLLRESQEMTTELRENEEELRQNAEEMRATQEQLEVTNKDLEEKIQEVHRSQSRQQSLLENASEIIAIYDKEKNITYISPSVENILGYTGEEVISGKFMERVDFKGARKLTKFLDTLLKSSGNNTDEDPVVEYSFVRKDGSVMNLESTGRNMMDDPSIRGLVLNTRDITQHKLAEKEQRLRGRMQSLSENSPDMILRLDFTGKFYYANPKFEYYTGINKDEVNNKTIEEINLNTEVANELNSILKIVKDSKDRFEKEFLMPLAGDAKCFMYIKAIPEFNEEKALETVLFVLSDISERKEFELQIQEKNQKISESINYSKRIQNAILPDIKNIQKVFKQSFMFYVPKDVVSGDFPWFFEKEEEKFIAVVDCTGHGVPGAMLSLIGYFSLNQVVKQPEVFNCGEILTQMHSLVVKTLRQDQEGADARDGMDVALCRYNAETKILHYAGAHRPLYHFRKDEFTEYKGTKSAIGGIPKDGEALMVFENHEILIEEGDSVFFFSDGLPDQFGGPDGRKFMTKKIKDLLAKNIELPMPKLYATLKKEYYDWLGDHHQIDDVLFIGMRF